MKGSVCTEAQGVNEQRSPVGQGEANLSRRRSEAVLSSVGCSMATLARPQTRDHGPFTPVSG